MVRRQLQQVLLRWVGFCPLCRQPLNWAAPPPKRLDDHIAIMVPVERSINPVTHTDWEGTGVEPDVMVPAYKALERALELARAQVEAAKPGPAP